MRQRAFLPFTAVGLIILILTVSVIGYYQWSDHQSRMKSIDDSASSSLVASMTSMQNNLEREARSSLYDALWRVGKNADNFGSRRDRQNAIRNLAAKRFQRYLSSLNQTEENPPNPDFKLGQDMPVFHLRSTNGGYPRAFIEMPENTIISGALPDNSLRLDLTIEDLETTADARYYLLQNRMESFRNGLEEVKDRWKYAEYAMAYAQAWAGGKVKLSKSRSRALFQLAWASHELSNFGSSDYLATGQVLGASPQADRVLEDQNSEVTVKPLEEGEIQELSKKVGATLGHLQSSGKKLRSAENEMRELKQFDPENQIDEISNRLVGLRNRIENLSFENAGRDFREISSDSRSAYSYPAKQSTKVLMDIENAKQSVKSAKNCFQEMLGLMEDRSSTNPLLKQLYENFTGSGSSSGNAQRISAGLDDVLDRLGSLEDEARSLKEKLQVPEGLESTFPDEFPTRFAEIPNENIEEAKGILMEAEIAAEKAEGKFEQAIRSGKKEADSFYLQLENEVRELTRRPEPNWSKDYKEYPEPGETPEETPITKTAEKYVLRNGEGTIGGAERVLEGIKIHLDLLTDLSEKFESERNEVNEFEVGDELRKTLKEKIGWNPSSNISRERSYEISPPEPLRDDPGISVYHKLKIEDVQYKRRDPVGLFNESAPPTPIYLWFIGITIHWAMWKVQIELKEPVVEEIFDYRNQTIPRPLVEGESGLEYIHKPLAYRRELDRDEFSFTLVVLSLRSFGISYGT